MDEAASSEELMQLDCLGPITLNTDGSMSRMANWAVLTEAEKNTAWRMIAKRNNARREVLLRQEHDKEINDRRADDDEEIEKKVKVLTYLDSSEPTEK